MINVTHNCHFYVMFCMLQLNNGDWGCCSFCGQSLLLWEKNMLIDLHSHLLPNIDDGSKSLRASIRMAKEAVDSGIKAALMTLII